MTIRASSATQLAQLFRKRELGRVAAMTSAVTEAAKEGAGVLGAHSPRDTGNLGENITVTVDSSSSTPGYSGTAAKIVQNAPYAAALEFGSRPHAIPFEAVLDWATRHAQGGEDPEAFAHAVWKKILENGTEPKHYTKDAIPAMLLILATRVRAEAGRKP